MTSVRKFSLKATETVGGKDGQTHGQGGMEKHMGGGRTHRD